MTWDQRPIPGNWEMPIPPLKYELLALGSFARLTVSYDPLRLNSQVKHRLGKLLSLCRVSLSGGFSILCAWGLCTVSAPLSSCPIGGDAPGHCRPLLSRLTTPAGGQRGAQRPPVLTFHRTVCPTYAWHQWDLRDIVQDFGEGGSIKWVYFILFP